jgi:hypothetical protein
MSMMRPHDVVSVRSAAGDDPFGHRVAVLLRQGHADALEREGHCDPEVLQHLGREIAGMGIQRGREGVQERGVQILLVEVGEVLGPELVAPDQALFGLVEGLPAVQVVRDPEVDPAAEERCPLLLRRGMAALVAVDCPRDRWIEFEVLRARDLPRGVAHGLVMVDQEEVILRQALAVARLDLLEDAGERSSQRLHLAGEKQDPRGIEALQVGLDHALSDLLAELMVNDVVLEKGLHDSRERLATELGGRGRGRQARRHQAAAQGEAEAVRVGPHPETRDSAISRRK